MIKKLRVKFIAASMLALALVLLVILGGINVMSYRKTVSDADAILSVLASNQGMFPQRMSPAEDGASRKGAPGNSSMEDGVFRKRGFSDETPYESRFFSVLLDEAGRVLGTDTGKIAAVDQAAAAEYAQEVWRSGQNRGFWEEYRFIRSTEAGGIRIIFLDCGRSITGILSLMASLGMWTAPVMPVATSTLMPSSPRARPRTTSDKSILPKMSAMPPDESPCVFPSPEPPSVAIALPGAGSGCCSSGFLLIRPDKSSIKSRSI